MHERKNGVSEDVRSFVRGSLFGRGLKWMMKESFKRGIDPKDWPGIVAGQVVTEVLKKPLPGPVQAFVNGVEVVIFVDMMLEGKNQSNGHSKEIPSNGRYPTEISSNGHNHSTAIPLNGMPVIVEKPNIEIEVL